MRKEFEENTVFVRDAPTRAQGRKYSLAAGAEIRFEGGKVPFHRKQIVISNPNTGADSSLMLRCLRAGQDADNATPLGDTDSYAVKIFGDSNLTLFTSDTLIVRNHQAGTRYVHILETFYT